ncbi:MAG: glycosyltransferase family 2 protein [Acidiferrobacterales bacterium]
MSTRQPRISICIPHWQVRALMSLCLRSIRKHSRNYDLEVIVVDNGSKDESLDYLRSLRWIRLIERPEETHTNWPRNVFTAWDRGIQEATGDYFITMHSDVFIKSDDWLDPYLERMDHSDSVAGVGAWKLELENPAYALQKLLINNAVSAVKNLFGKKKRTTWRRGHYPRDYCAMYRREVVLKHKLSFVPTDGRGGGYTIARRLWEAGYQTRMIPVRVLYRKMSHIAHGTAAIVAEKPLHHKRAQTKVERKVRALFSEEWVKALQTDSSLDQ